MVMTGVDDRVFNSILWPGGLAVELRKEDPDCFVDLNIDQIIGSVVAPYKDYNLRPFFDTLAIDPDTVKYRQDIFRDLEKADVFACMYDFSIKMRDIHRYISGIDRLFEWQRQGWILDAALLYFGAMNDLAQKLAGAVLNSEGLISLRNYVQKYVESERFRYKEDKANDIKRKLSVIRYEMSFGSSRVTVRKDKGRESYNGIIQEAFSKFRNDKKTAANKKRVSESSMNHVEAGILALIARLFPEEFDELSAFCENNSSFIDPVVEVVYREIHFYLSYLQYISAVKKTGLEFCLPEICTDHDIYCLNSFDLALAHKALASSSKVVANDFQLSGGEKALVVTGPNNGGKTTFARSFGQAFFLFALGLPIPGSKARLFVPDNIYTHFEKSEDPEDLMGKLESDLVRMRKILYMATNRSIIIVNEMLSSTTLKDAIQIGTEIIGLIMRKNVLCVYVTFLDEFARLDGVVSMACQVDPFSPDIRTFKIRRTDPNGLAYAKAIAEKYDLTYEKIMRRISG